MNPKLLAVLGLAALLFACKSDEQTPAKPQTPSPAPSANTPAANPPANTDATPAAGAQATHVISTAEVHDAICGHVLEDVGHCGNYVSIDGKWVEILWPAFGKMEWCSKGKAGAKIEITGEMKDGKFVASSYRLAQ